MIGSTIVSGLLEALLLAFASDQHAGVLRAKLIGRAPKVPAEVRNTVQVCADDFSAKLRRRNSSRMS
jgi:hypothetical protein